MSLVAGTSNNLGVFNFASNTLFNDFRHFPMTTSSSPNPVKPFLPNAIQRLANMQLPLRITLWMLRLDREEPRLRFVHGNAIAGRPGRPQTQWFRYEVDRLKDDQRLIRYSADVSPEQAHALLTNLASGAVVYPELEAAGLSQPDLAASELATIALHSVPTAYFPPSTSLSASHSTRTSPSDEAGCYCVRLCRTDRFAFLAKDPSDAEPLLKWLCIELGRETGLALATAAGDAFGQFEIYWFPSIDEHERPKLEVASHKPLRLRILDRDSNCRYAIHIQAEQVSDTASDELFILDAGKTDLTVDLPEPNDGVLIRVWKMSETGRWELWHEQHDVFIRSINGRMNLVGLTGHVGARWLDELPQRLSSRVERFKQISQVTHAAPMAISSREAWETAIEVARQFVADAHPTASKSRFFERGWGTDEHKFDFAEWLKQTLSTHPGTIVLTDPYFDVLGLDLVCRASGAAKELVVLTCTQVPSLDDTATAPRAKRLQTQAKELFTVLRGLSLRIYDLQSPNSESSTKQLFHDRYLLLFSENGNAAEGYNLSTSLQSAATTSPLLVTEIPTDILHNVADYVSGLMQSKENSEAVVHTIFPTEELRRTPHSNERNEKQTRTIAAALIGCGRASNDDEAMELLRSLDGYEDGKVRLSFSDEEFNKLTASLLSSSLENAAQVWDGMVASCLGSYYGGLPDLVRRLFDKDNVDDIARFLTEYLEGHASGVLGLDTSTHVRTLEHVLELPFKDAVRRAAEFYDRHHEFPIGTTWPIRYAVIFLIWSSAGNFDRLVSSLRSKKKNAETTFASPHRGAKGSRPTREAAERAHAILTDVDAILSAATSAITWFAQPQGPGLRDEYAKSSEAFARALWAIAMWRKVQRGDLEPESLCSSLSLLDGPERRLVLAQVVYKLRVQANWAKTRPEYVKKEKELPDWLTDAIIREADDSCDVEELVTLIKGYSGPLTGNWAVSTHSELLSPIIEAGRLSKESAFEAWNGILADCARDEHFSNFAFELVQVWGFCIWFLNREARNAVLGRQNNTLRRASRALQEPFLRSRDHTRWSREVHEAGWMLLRAWAVKRAQPVDDHDPTARELLKAAYEVAINERLASVALGDMKPAIEHVLADIAKAKRGD